MDGSGKIFKGPPQIVTTASLWCYLGLSAVSRCRPAKERDLQEHPIRATLLWVSPLPFRAPALSYSNAPGPRLEVYSRAAPKEVERNMNCLDMLLWHRGVIISERCAFSNCLLPLAAAQSLEISTPQTPGVTRPHFLKAFQGEDGNKHVNSATLRPKFVGPPSLTLPTTAKS